MVGQSLSALSVGVFICNCLATKVYWQIAGYGMGVGDHKVA